MSKPVSKKSNKSAQKQTKAAVITPEPQHKEHMHLKYVQDSPALQEVYISVSDGNLSELVDDTLEKDVAEFTDTYLNKDASEIKHPEKVLAKLRELYKSYRKHNSLSDNIFGGWVTKCRIREGMLLLIEKKLIKANSRSWMDHFSKTYGLKHLRSANDYMVLAKVPNIIRYSVFKKARLVEVLRAIKELKIEGDDPVAEFLNSFKIPYDPEQEDNDQLLDDLRVQIDAAIASMKIESVEKEEDIKLGVRLEQLKSLIAQGVVVDKGLVNDLVLIKKNEGTPSKHLNDLILRKKSRSQAVCLEKAKRVQGIAKLTAGLTETVKYLQEHTDVIQLVSEDQVSALEAKVKELKDLLANS